MAALPSVAVVRLEKAIPKEVLINSYQGKLNLSQQKYLYMTTDK